MKLVLANNQNDRFTAFYRDLQSRSNVPFDYASYRALLFWFDSSSDKRIEVHNVKTDKALTDYDGVYIKSVFIYELAASTAICCDYLGIKFVDQELHNPPSLSKLTMHAKLAATGVLAPKSFGGSKQAVIASKHRVIEKLTFPAVLKRADADRGIDNFKIENWPEVVNILQSYADKTIWILQEFMPNNGYYRVNFYDRKPVFSIFRKLETRPDSDSRKSHFYKPSGGVNASLVEITNLPPAVLKTCQDGLNAMNRQVAGVDCIYDAATDKAYILEVNYNPQLVTIGSFKDIRQKAFLDSLMKIC
jgi:hypothetical protein